MSTTDWLQQRLNHLRELVESGRMPDGTPIDSTLLASMTGGLAAAVANLDIDSIAQRAERLRRGGV